MTWIAAFLQSRKDLLQAEILLYEFERKQVDDWVDQWDLFPPNTATSQDPESFSSSIPVKTLSDRPPRHAECFDKVRLSEYLDKSINEQPASLTEKRSKPDPQRLLSLGGNWREPVQYFCRRFKTSSSSSYSLWSSTKKYANRRTYQPRGKGNKNKFFLPEKRWYKWNSSSR